MKLIKGCMAITPGAMLIDDENVWVSDICNNEIYKFVWGENHADIVAKINGEDEYQYNLFSSMIKYKNSLILIPMGAKRVYMVNMNTYDVKPFDIPEPSVKYGYKYDEKIKFVSAALFKDKIYLFGATYPGILEIDLLTNTITNHNEWLIDCYKELENDFIYFRGVQLYKGEIYAPLCATNKIMVFSPKSNTARFITIEGKKRGFAGIYIEDNAMWLIPRGEGTVEKWILDYDSNKKEMDVMVSELMVSPSCSYIYEWKNNVYILPIAMQNVIKIDKQYGNYEKLILSRNCIGTTDGKHLLIGSCEKSIFVLDEKQEMYIYMDKETENYHLCNIYDSYRTIMARDYDEKIVDEEYEGELKIFVDSLN